MDDSPWKKPKSMLKVWAAGRGLATAFNECRLPWNVVLVSVTATVTPAASSTIPPTTTAATTHPSVASVCIPTIHFPWRLPFPHLSLSPCHSLSLSFSPSLVFCFHHMGFRREECTTWQSLKGRKLTRRQSSWHNRFTKAWSFKCGTIWFDSVGGARADYTLLCVMLFWYVCFKQSLNSIIHFNENKLL